MNTENILTVDLSDDFIFSCPHCKTCSIKLTPAEYQQVKLGQLMLAHCSVCDSGVTLDVKDT